MRALTWQGVNKLSVEDVPEPHVQNRQDIVVKPILSTACGSDLHLISGYIPTMRAGDVIGHEFMGEVVDVGPDVRKHKIGDRVVVSCFIACGRCWYCEKGLYSSCDNSNTNPGIAEALWGYSSAGCIGYSHAVGGYTGSHAEYTRVPFGDYTAFAIPDEVDDRTALYASDTGPTGWMGADLGNVQPGDVVAVWGAGAIGQMAAQAAMLLGAERVINIDRLQYRLDMCEQIIGSETLNFEKTDLGAEIRERTGGRGPDVCIEAVGMEAASNGPAYVYDQVKQQLRMQTDRPTAVRQAIDACRKGGTVFVLGVFAGLVDKFPLGTVMNRGLTLRSAQVHGPRYIPMLLERMAKGEIKTSHFATHVLPLDDSPRGYDLFKNKQDGCIRAVFSPDGASLN